MIGEADDRYGYHVHEDIPLQDTQTNNCGVFLCKFADFFIRREPITFTDENMVYYRHRMVSQLVEKDLNAF